MYKKSNNLNKYHFKFLHVNTLLKLVTIRLLVKKNIIFNFIHRKVTKIINFVFTFVSYWIILIEYLNKFSNFSAIGQRFLNICLHLMGCRVMFTWFFRPENHIKINVYRFEHILSIALRISIINFMFLTQKPINYYYYELLKDDGEQ